VNAQFVATVEKLQGVMSRVPSFLEPISSGRRSFDIVMYILMTSGVAAIVVMALIIPVLWYGIFSNWKARILEMRRGRFGLFFGAFLSFDAFLSVDAFFYLILFYPFIRCIDDFYDADISSTSLLCIQLQHRISLVFRQVFLSGHVTVCDSDYQI
jgi:hypothetical protein